MIKWNGHSPDGLHPRLRELLLWAEQQPWSITITSTRRTDADQARLYSWGRPPVVNPLTGPLPGKPYGTIVTDARFASVSAHGVRSDGYGHAFDCAAPLAVYKELAARGLQLGVRWGGTFLVDGAPDYPHFEEADWRKVPWEPRPGGAPSSTICLLFLALAGAGAYFLLR